MDSGCFLSLMGANMKVVGIKENTMEKEYIKLHLEQNMTVIGKTENIMDLVLLCGLMEVFTRENGETAEKTEEENLLE
jgi:hypothetical protein